MKSKNLPLRGGGKTEGFDERVLLCFQEIKIYLIRQKNFAAT